jgi:hypothetical protein
MRFFESIDNGNYLNIESLPYCPLPTTLSKRKTAFGYGEKLIMTND